MLLPALSSLSESSAYALLRPRNIGNVDGLAAPLEHDDDPRKKLGEWSSLIGIVTAIVGNVLIALALNVQRYAHIQLHKRRAQVRERARQALRDAAKTQSNGKHNGVGNGGGYGTVGADSNGAESTGTDGALHTGRSGQARGGEAGESDPLTHSRFRNGSAGERTGGEEDGEDDDDDDGEIKVASTYLKSPSWWLGQILITIGEMGNFLAYGFAPASIVSPLGVVALISNCVIAPFFFKEVFRQRDFWGVLVSIAGAVTVVLSAKQEETKLAPHDIWDAITTMEFEIYVAVSCSLIMFLMWASPRYGNRTILIDLGLVGLFGGYTVLATKGVSSMLSSTLLRAFTTPVTYALLVVLLGTAVMQVRYVNKALQRFDSTQVIPIQFVLFTLSVILGSAVLYRDFERTSAEQAAKFIGGCMLTFFGVFLITSGRQNADDDEDGLSDEEGIEETIGLAEQSSGPAAPAAGPQTPLPSSRRSSDAARSRRSSRASRVSFLDAVNKPLAVLSETGVPSPRVPARSSFGADGAEGSPWSDNPWRDAAISSPSPHPGMTPQALSAESVPTISSMTHTHPLGVSPGNGDGPSSASVQLPLDGAPVTPRPARDPTLSSSRPSSHHFPPGPLYSPSPLSSTVSAVVADTLLRHVGGGVGSNGDSSSPRTLLRARRSRPGLRNSLFVPQDELVLLYDAEEGAAALDPEAFSGGARSQGPGSPSEREGLLGVGGGGGAGDAQQRHTFRTRARSVSHAIGDLFGRKKRRRGPSGDGGDEGEEEEQNGSGPATGALAGGARPGLPGSQAQVAKVSAPSAETL